MRLLLVGQNLETTASIRLGLIEEEFVCDTADVADDGLEAGKFNDYDVILFDLSGPKKNRYEALRRLRSACIPTPVLILSSHDDLDPRIQDLGFGNDDLVTNPSDHRALTARIRAIARHTKSRCEATVQTGKLVVNLDTREVSVDNHPVHLTGKEYGILELLSLRKSTTLTKEMFLTHLYAGMHEPELKIIDVFVCKLRKKLAQATGGNHYIETVWGRGYRLRDPDLTGRLPRSGKLE